jgi:hypothetical protein
MRTLLFLQDDVRELIHNHPRQGNVRWITHHPRQKKRPHLLQVEPHLHINHLF